MRYSWVLVVVVAACVRPSATECGNGFVCPAGLSCAQVTTSGVETTICVTDDQTAACDGIGDGEACAGASLSTCHGGACFPDVCGNGRTDASEACDDGNTGDGDGCSASCTSLEVCRNSEVDLSRGEQCDKGDALGHDGCTSNCKDEVLQWRPVLEDHPVARIGAAAVYDAKRGEIVIFGGRVPSTTYVMNDMFGWNGIRWRVKEASIRPTPRSLHAMAYDAARGEVVLFGGDVNSVETWTWRGGDWELENPVTRPPLQNGGMVMTYDAAKRRVIMVYESGTWVWDGSDWHELPQTNASLERRSAGLAYDPARGVVVMFGGLVGSAYPTDTWELEGDTWVQKSPTSPPPGRTSASMVFSPRNQEILLVGGTGASTAYHDTWLWNGTRWLQKMDAPTSGGGINDPTLLVGAAAAADPVRGRVAVFTNTALLIEWDGAEWSIPAAGVPARYAIRPGRIWTAAATDVRNRRVMIYGGRFDYDDGAGNVTPMPIDDTWIYDGGWTANNVSFGAPRFGSSAVYDATADEFVVFGGCNSASDFAETWTLTGLNNLIWQQRATTGTRPPARCFAQMVYDHKSGNVILFGGRDKNYAPMNDLWIWNGTTKTWSQVSPSTKPPARYAAAGGYDPIRGELVVFGGVGFDGSEVKLADTWTWNGTAWTEVIAPGPLHRLDAAMAWDASRKRLVMVDGGAGLSPFDQVWEFDGATHTWEVQDVGGLARQGHALVPSFDERGGLILVDGFDTDFDGTTRIHSDLWRLSREGSVSYETCRLIDADGDELVGCEDLDCWSVCTPACPPGSDCAGKPLLCGDLTCDSNLEQCTTCPTDCGPCVTLCGDFICGTGETAASCPGDCTPAPP